MIQSGWYLPTRSRVWHFYDDGHPRALCGGARALASPPRAGGATWAVDGEQDCAECRRKVDARRPHLIADALLPAVMGDDDELLDPDGPREVIV